MGKNSESLVPRMERINLLMDIYGDLLTDKQRRFVRLHYSDDLSFGEIADQYKVSRQAVYDAVKHAMGNLERYEGVLSLLDRFGGMGEGRSGSPVGKKGEPMSEIALSLGKLKMKIQKQSIIYNVDWIVQDLQNIITSLNAFCDQGNSPESPPGERE